MNRRTAENLALLDFGRGLICAISEKQNKINFGDWKKFHQAFGKVFEEAAKTVPHAKYEFISGIKPDPMFGFYREVQVIILEAEEDTLITRGTGILYLDLERNEARKELERNHYPNWFRKLADCFSEAISEVNNQPIT